MTLPAARVPTLVACNGLRGAFLSTHETGTDAGSGEGPAKVFSVGLQIVLGVLGVASFTAAAVHHLDQREIMRVEGERAAEIKLAAAEIKRVEGERRLSEERLRAELERYKYDLQLRHTQDYKPYQAAKEQANKERGGTGGPQKETD